MATCIPTAVSSVVQPLARPADFPHDGKEHLTHSASESWATCPANVVSHSPVFKTAVLLFCFYLLQFFIYLSPFSPYLLLIFFF